MSLLLSPVLDKLTANVAKPYFVICVANGRAEHACGYFIGSGFKPPVFAQSCWIKSLLLAEFGMESEASYNSIMNFALNLG